MKTCRLCGVSKVLADFSRRGRGSLKRRTECKQCAADRVRARNRADPVAARARRSPRDAEYRARNRAKEQQRHVAYLARPGERERHRARVRRNYEQQPEKYINRSRARRRAQNMATVGDPVTVQVLRDRDGDACAYCRVQMNFRTFRRGEYVWTKATIDHVVPLSRGGEHSRANCVLACNRCNRSKGNRLLSEWQPRAAA